MSQPKVSKRPTAKPSRIVARNLLSNQTIIQLTVGTNAEQTTFNLHQDLLCYYSTYFRRMLLGPYTEAETKKVVWEEEDPNVVSVFVSWLYTQELNFFNEQDVAIDGTSRMSLESPNETGDQHEDASDGSDDERPDSLHATTDPTFLTLYHLWTFADRRGIAAFGNAVVDMIHNCSSSYALPNHKECE